MEAPVPAPHLTHPERSLLPTSPLPFPISYASRIKTEQESHYAGSTRDTPIYNQPLYTQNPQPAYRPQPPYNHYHEPVPRLIHPAPHPQINGGNISALAQIAFPTQPTPGTSHPAEHTKHKDEHGLSYSSKMKSSVVNQQLWRPY